MTLIPTTIGGLLSAIGIAGMDRLVKANVIAKSGRAVEAAGDVDTLLLDKTGTITFGNRMADAFDAAAGVSERELVEAPPLCLPRRRDAGGQVDRRAGAQDARPRRRRLRARSPSSSPFSAQYAHVRRRSRRAARRSARARPTRSWHGATRQATPQLRSSIERIATHRRHAAGGRARPSGCWASSTSRTSSSRASASASPSCAGWASAPS